MYQPSPGQTQQQGQSQYAPQQNQMQFFSSAPNSQQQAPNPQPQGVPQQYQQQQMQGYGNSQMMQQMQQSQMAYSYGNSNLNNYAAMSMNAANNNMYGLRAQQVTGFRSIEVGKPDPKLTLAALIITVCDGSTYDNLFHTVKQDAGEGSRVGVYACRAVDLTDLIDVLSNPSKHLAKRNDDLHLLVRDLQAIDDPTCVAINYECCSGCSDHGFSVSAERIIEHLIAFLKRGYLVMYSDFSAKAIITAWSTHGEKTALGPNPFIRTGQHSQSVVLNFNPGTLKTCISSQLQSVGELCPDQDHCTVHCMGGTVRYSVKGECLADSAESGHALPYDAQVLTIAQFPKTEHSVSIQVPCFGLMKKGKAAIGIEDASKLPMKTLWGDAGHVVLDYSKGKKAEVATDGKEQEQEQQEGQEGQADATGLKGKVLMSMTHWCELVKLGDSVSDDVLFQVAAKNLGTGSSAYQTMKATWESYGGANATGAQYQQQQACVSQWANQMVQMRAPCNNNMNSNY